MRQLLLVLALFMPGPALQAQDSLLLQAIELHDPSLSAHLMASESATCSDSPDPVYCSPTTYGLGTLADGTLLSRITPPEQPACGGSTAYTLRQSDYWMLKSDGYRQNAFTIHESVCIGCIGILCDKVIYTSLLPDLDAVNGLVHLRGYSQFYDVTAQTMIKEERGWVTISGMPTLFDTLLTFIPGQPSMNILTPAMPDGFRSADSLQVWTGNVRSMPDWSQAQPLACMAAQNPTPGQIVSVADTLPDPPVGQGRYYLVASQNGPDRRLGRKCVNGAFSARQPAGLPVCQ